jgi:hypothetical protein
MKHSLILAFLFIALTHVMLYADEPGGENSGDAIKILFIGNSFTYSNDMPHIFQGMAVSRNRKVEIAMHAPGGCTLEKHWKDGKAAELIGGQKWDYVVLQEHSEGPLNDPKSMKEYAGKFDELIKKQGARTVLFMTWADQDKKGTQRKIALAYEDIAKELGAVVVPVGLAWQKALAANKPLVLHSADKKHPSETGSYLAALAFFAVLVDPKTDGLAGRIGFEGKTLTNLSTADAARLQRYARETVSEEKDKLEKEAEKEKGKEKEEKGSKK